MNFHSETRQKKIENSLNRPAARHVEACVLRPSLILIVLLLAGRQAPATPLLGAEATNVWYVQVVRGTDQATAPDKNWKRIGPKLSGSLARAFKWQHHYEVKQVQIPVTPGQPARVNVGPERELHIHFTSAHDAELSLLRKGKVTRKDSAHLKNRMAILGGDEKDDGWFVVVRRDKPTTE